ncbi:hypothetical protein KA107_02750 [Candidatus Pacearchaeota archaeon]|nr:hypothetical protein [Candidatus Pacearchaeota archaeon]
MEKKIYFASSNKAKLTRLKKIFGYVDKSIIVEQVPEVIEVEETGKDVLENAELKVLPYKNKYTFPVIGGDTGVFFEGEDFNPLHVKRICLNGEPESKFSQEEIAIKIRDFYIQIAKKHGGKKEFYYKDGWAILLPDGTIRKEEYNREYILTDRQQGAIDIYFPMRSLYVVKKTGKSTYEETEEDFLSEFSPQIEAFKNLLKGVYL